MGSKVPPITPTRPPATERGYPGLPEPAREDRPRPRAPEPDVVRTARARCDRLPRAAGRGPAAPLRPDRWPTQGSGADTALTTRQPALGYGMASDHCSHRATVGHEP